MAKSDQKMVSQMIQFKKKVSFFLFIFFFVALGFTQSAHAVIFTDLLTFNTTISYGSSQTTGASWIHDITDNIGGNSIGSITLIDATLTINHDDTGMNLTAENWTVDGLGTLVSDNNPNTSVFNFNLAALADLQADGLFTVALTESTSGADNFILLNSTLSGNYRINNANPNPNGPTVPEPMTSSLVGFGIGVSALVRRFFNKK